MSTAQGSSVLNMSLGKSLTGLSSWFHNVTGPQVSQSLRKDASTRRHLKSGKRGKSETWDYLRLDFFLQRFNVILFSVYKSQNGPTAQCEKTPPEISEGLGGQAGSWAQKYRSLFQNFGNQRQQENKCAGLACWGSIACQALLHAGGSGVNRKRKLLLFKILYSTRERLGKERKERREEKCQLETKEAESILGMLEFSVWTSPWILLRQWQ